MHLRNKSVFLVAVILLAATWVSAQNSAPASQAPPSAVTQQPSGAPSQAPQQPTAGQDQQGESPAPAPAPNQPGDTVQVPPGQAPSGQSNDVYIFKKEVDEVTLHATVVDDHFRPITGLTKNDFTVYEDGKPQKVTYFKNEDIPVALGIVIDNSGSMRDKRPQVNAAAINLVRSSNPQDQVFIVNFNEEYFLDQDYTGSVPKLKDALERIESRGGTALYDAVVASSDHLKKSGALEKKVLLVVTDGEDNASRESLEQALRRLEEQNGPTIYTIGLLGEEHNKRARRALREMAEDTGGVAFFPKDLSEVQAITTEIAHDIRNQYTIQYKPTTPQSAGGYRTVKVVAQAPGYKHLQVRTRSGYYAGQQQQRTASTSGPSGSQ
jgi:Ca-activated chloride channel family protein